MSALKKSIIALFSITSPIMAHAAGLAIVEQNASRLGNAYAGGAAEANDGSVISFNPAGMSNLERNQLNLSGMIIVPNVRFNSGGSISAAGTPMTGDNGGNAASTAFIPNVYFVDSLANGMKYGLAITAPAGTKIGYENEWVGRYFSTKAKLEVLNISPAISGKLSPHTAVGAALDIQYAHANLSKSIDFGSACYGIAPPAFCAGEGLYPQTADGQAKVNGHDWAVGYHLGIQHDLTADTRVGALYRSKVKHKLEGSATYENVAGFLNGAFPATVARADITLPEVVSLSATHKITPRLTVLADAAWTRWSRFNELRVRFDTPPPSGDDVTVEEWKNSWRFALGANYQYSTDLTLRAGIARDQGPVPDGRRTPAIPDGTRNMVAFGVAYKLNKNSTVDFGYSHLFVPKGVVNIRSATQGTLAGSYKSSADIVALQYNYGF